MDGKKLEYKGEEALKELERLTEQAEEVQEKILKEILTRNGVTEYLNKYLGGATDISDFKRRVPVITYSQIRPYIQKIANGEDSSLISGHPITEMLISSGTSGGEPKLMPSISEDLDRRTYLYNLIIPIMNQYVPGLDEGKAMYLYFAKAEMSTPSGMPARPVLTSYYKSKHFKCRARDPYNDFTSPDGAILCTDSRQSMYCQLLAGLVHRRQVLRLGAVFASAFLRAVAFLERNWTRFCDDIRSGRLDPSVVTDPACRSAMSDILPAPNPILADDIEAAICSGDEEDRGGGRSVCWKGILPRLWPRAKYIEVVVTGSMSQYIPALEFYTAGKLPLVCTMYASSECYFGVNINPLSKPADVAYTLLPNMAYFEFIELENGAQQYYHSEEDGQDDDDQELIVSKDKLVDLVNVKLGRYYELVATTFAGLYRYRIGDVLQVVGFHNRAPQFRFICRRNVILSIDNDKTNEEDLHKSVSAAKRLLEPYNLLLAEYTSYADTSTVPGHYVLFWEIAATSPDAALPPEARVVEECCAAVEESLDYVYRRCRAFDKSVGPLEIRMVEQGTFEGLMDLVISQGGSINQYKTPRCINGDSSSALALLDSRVTACFYSPRDPVWTP
ncbi:hypothetical protein H6P81_016373 [Aristolochia fimbriata]|uniref:Indole-3-acetic acid-amido synthetase GH3.9 n=1 Tax=Aristolochia fimbriata TaxID=158543 RepID=A0AAV7E8J0_ARIFI|nr:hypothetical protein H6P81_016373 [Aristolochia fimbriata]